jgi:hypothetical protein
MPFERDKQSSLGSDDNRARDAASPLDGIRPGGQTSDCGWLLPQTVEDAIRAIGGFVCSGAGDDSILVAGGALPNQRKASQ